MNANRQHALAPPAGLEPTTLRLEGGCSVLLSYGGTHDLSIIAACRHPRSGPDLLLFADEPVHRLPDEVGMAVVPRVLLDHVAHDPPQTGSAAVGPGAPGQAVQPPIRQRFRH